MNQIKKLDYQLTKNIGFLLKDIILEEDFAQKSENSKSSRLNIDKLEFLKNLNNLLEDLFSSRDGGLINRFLFYKHERGFNLFNYELEKKFLYKYDLYSGKTRYSHLVFNEVGFKKIKGFWSDFIRRIEEEILDPLNNYLNLYEKGINPKESEIRSVLRKSQGKYYFELLKEFFDGLRFNYKEKNINKIDFELKIKDIKNRINSISELIQKNPFENKNEVTKFSFNYYTLNKRPLNYKGNIDDIQSIENHYKGSKVFYEKRLNEKINQFGFIENHKHIINLVNKNLGEDLRSYSLEKAVEKLKEFKATIKSNFYKDINRANKDKLDLDYFNRVHPLFKFKDKDSFNKFLNSKADGREKYFNYEFNDYKNLCNFYQKLAVERGRIKAQIKGLEKEKEEFINLKYWAFIADYHNEKYLILLKKEFRKDFKNYLDSCKEEKLDFTLYNFKSFTFRALEKLIFNFYNNDFFEGIKQDERIYNILETNKIKTKYEIKESLNNKDLILFYKYTLTAEYTKNNLDLEDFNLKEVLSKDFDNIEDFRIALDGACYFIKGINLNWDNFINKWKDNISIFKIYSYDLIGKQKELKFHTRIWKDFWNSFKDSRIRLNSEGSVFLSVVDEDERRTILLKKEKLETEGKKFIRNRKLEDYYYKALFNFNLYFPSKEIKISFKEKDKIDKSIEEYNNNFNQQNDFKNLFYIGIDLGEIELATLGIIKFKDSSNNFELQKIKAYKIKDEFINPQNIKNPSLLDGNCFEEIELDSLDLSKAKLIRDKIVINGDISTYLKLKIVSAKRKLFDLVKKQGEALANEKICFYNETKNNLGVNYLGNDVFVIRKNNEEEKYLRVYKYDLEFENICPREYLNEELNNYYRSLLEDESINYYEEINSLRKAISSNIVGIVSYLQDIFPSIIVLENLNKETREYHMRKENFSLDSQIDWMIYRKLETKKLCPPNINNFKFLKDLKNKNSVFQLGGLVFVPEESTSKICPKCSAKNLGLTEEKFKEAKFELRNIKCKQCSEEFHPDLIACINIAKSAFNFLNSK